MVLDYCEKVSDYILTFIKNRLLTLVRCPGGYRECFYQKKSPTEIHDLHLFKTRSKTNQDLNHYIYKEKNIFFQNQTFFRFANSSSKFSSTLCVTKSAVLS